MNVLYKKMFRTIRGALGQFLAVVSVVMVGIAIYISMTTASFNMTRSKEMFYQENNFADYYFHVVKAPESVTKQIEAIPGVTKATGRIQKDLTIIKGYRPPDQLSAADGHRG